jgi:hypothetical protein
MHTSKSKGHEFFLASRCSALIVLLRFTLTQAQSDFPRLTPHIRTDSRYCFDDFTQISTASMAGVRLWPLALNCSPYAAALYRLFLPRTLLISS